MHCTIQFRDPQKSLGRPIAMI